MIRNICLIGLPTAGKSTIGKQLFQYLQKGFIDTDNLICQAYNKELPEIISKYGNERFLDIEKEVILSLNHENVVLATGGSVIYRPESMNHIKQTLKCDVYHLCLSKKEFLQRINNPKNRGVISKDDQSMTELYNERMSLYDKHCDYIINSNKEVDLDLFKPYEYWRQPKQPYIMYTNKHKYGNSSYPCPQL